MPATPWFQATENQKKLATAMQELSQHHASLSWSNTSPWEIWAAMWGALRPVDEDYGVTFFEMPEIDRDALRRTHIIAGGWWYWNDDYAVESFVPAGEWAAIFEATYRDKLCPTINPTYKPIIMRDGRPCLRDRE